MTIQNETAASSWGSTALRVEPVEQAGDRRRFIRFPWQVYAGNPYWVPPLLYERRRFFDPTINSFFRHAEVQLFIARRGDRDIGTITAFINHTYNEAIRKGYQRAELSLIVESNMAMRRTVEALGAQIAKTYRVYEKLL